METPSGMDARATDSPGATADFRFDPATPLTLAIARAADPSATSTAPLRPPALDEVPALILSLLGRTEPSLTPMELRVLRACLCLAGERLPLVGGLDADFYEALLAFKERHRVEPLDPRLDLPTLTLIVKKASVAVGGADGSPVARLVRGIRFDVLRAPELIAEAPGIVSLIRELKGGRTRMPMMLPIPFEDDR
jgi:hypothetical protein